MLSIVPNYRRYESVLKCRLVVSEKETSFLDPPQNL